MPWRRQLVDVQVQPLLFLSMLGQGIFSSFDVTKGFFVYYAADTAFFLFTTMPVRRLTAM